MIRAAQESDLAKLVELDARNFGTIPSESAVEAARRELDLDRFVVVEDGEQLVGAAGSYPMELTVPGGRQLAVSGVTWVSVAATHRRQGLLRQLINALQRLSAGFGEPAMALTASESGIYERFGYGMATETRVVEIDRRTTRIRPDWEPEPVELAVAQERLPELKETWDRYRRSQPGEVNRPPGLFSLLCLRRSPGPDFAALHPDGYAIYDFDQRWVGGQPAHRLNVRDFVATTAPAHLALWHHLLSIDLVTLVRSRHAVSLDDPLPSLVTNPRAVRTMDLLDGLWIHVTDPATCFAARTYRVDGQLSIGVVDSVKDISNGTVPAEVFIAGTGDLCEIDKPPDLIACRSSLGLLLLGGNASRLAQARRVRADERTLRRADVLLGTGRTATCRTWF